MPILLVHNPLKPQVGVLKGRVLVGRWQDNTIVIDDPTVASIHAWISVQNGQYYIADAGTRNGTTVRGQRIKQRHVLANADTISVGPLTLEYRAGDDFPPGYAPIDLIPRTPDELSGKKGIFTDCACGAPLWVPVDFQGQGQCRFCGNKVSPVAKPPPLPARPAPAPLIVPAIARTFAMKPQPPMPPVVAPPPMPTKRVSLFIRKNTICGICHAPVLAADETTKCPSCGLEFHCDCWKENHGCSAYGCSQVGAVA